MLRAKNEIQILNHPVKILQQNIKQNQA